MLVDTGATTTWTEGDLAPHEALWPALLGRTPCCFLKCFLGMTCVACTQSGTKAAAAAAAALGSGGSENATVASPPPSSIPRVETVRSTRWRP